MKAPVLCLLGDTTGQGFWREVKIRFRIEYECLNHLTMIVWCSNMRYVCQDLLGDVFPKHSNPCVVWNLLWFCAVGRPCLATPVHLARFHTCR